MIKHLIALSFFTGLTLSLVAQGECAISNLTVTPHETCTNGMFLVDVDFDITNPQGEVFGIVGNATNYGFFMYEDLPVTLGPLPGDGETEWQFIVYDLEEPNCQSTYIFGTYDCCTISNVVIDQIACMGMSAFQARVNFTHSNTGNVGFEVYSVTGNLLGTFLYTSLPVIVTNIPSFRIGPTSIRICDLGSDNCCRVVQFQDPDCKKDDCEIYNLDVDTLGCDNGEFYVALNFNQILGGANFSVNGNGTNYGTYPYSALPLLLGPLEGDGTTDYEFIVTGTGPGNHCNAIYDLGPVTCPPGCGFDDVEIQSCECRGEDAFSVMIDFFPVNPREQGFSVYAHGQLLGSFSYDDLPIMVDSFPWAGDFFDEIVLCDNIDASCCDTIEFEALFCDGCVMNKMEITPTVCDDNDEFFVNIDFYYFNQSDSFQIIGSGTLFGQFAYQDLPISLGPFGGDSMSYFEFLALDSEDGLCFNGGELGIIDCDCDFEAITVDTLACTGNGVYSLLLNFTPIQVTHETFDVFAGDLLIGTYRYADLPVIIPAFPASGNPTDVISICDSETPTCCASYEFVPKDCVCEISNIVAQTSVCDTTTGTFDLYLDFDAVGIADEFTVSLGNNIVGTVHRANLPDTLFGLSTNTGSVLLTVCGNGHPDCCNTTQFENPCQGPCDITNLSVGVSSCDPITKTFYMTVDFGWVGDYQEFYYYQDGVLIDSVEGANLPDTLFGLTTEPDTVVFSVQAKGRDDCFASVELILEECRVIPCDIFDLIAIPGTCNSDTTFALTVAFGHQGFTTDFVDIWTGSLYLGAHPKDSLPIVFDAFPWDGSDMMSIEVCQSGDLSCCESVSFAAPYCGCDVLNVTATHLGYCNPDSTSFPVVIDIEWAGDVGAFTVYSGGLLVAVLEANDLPDTVLNFPLPEMGFAEVTVCGDNDSTCCATQSFEPPVCNVCTISIVSVDTFQCTGASTFSAWIEYTTEGFTGPIQFWANDVFLGEFQQFHPLLLLNIPESDESITLRVCNAESPSACCDEFEFEGMHCADDSCMISNITVQLWASDSNTQFTPIIDFDFDNVGAAFTVFGNGNQYGVFNYSNVPVTLPIQTCDTSTIWQFVVLDLENIGCQDDLTYGLIDCDSLIDATTDVYPVLPLEVRYGSEGASFTMPDKALEFLVWTYDGRLMYRDESPDASMLVLLSKYIKTPGLYFVQVRTEERMYVGKVVGF